MQVRRTDGDFPHVRRRSVFLACGCSTCCCLTILGGGAGAIAGIVTGIVASARGGRGSGNAAADAAIFVGRFLGLTVMYGAIGLLTGAGLGFLLDNLMGNW